MCGGRKRLNGSTLHRYRERWEKTRIGVSVFFIRKSRCLSDRQGELSGGQWNYGSETQHSLGQSHKLLSHVRMMTKTTDIDGLAYGERSRVVIV